MAHAATITSTTRRESTRTRFTLTEIAVLAAIVGLLALAACWPMLKSAPAPRTTTVRVSANDTIWSLAAGSRLPGRTTAQTVAEIRRLNSLHSSSLTVGELLVVPADAGDESARAER